VGNREDIGNAKPVATLLKTARIRKSEGLVAAVSKLNSGDSKMADRKIEDQFKGIDASITDCLFDASFSCHPFFCRLNSVRDAAPGNQGQCLFHIE